MKNSFKAGKQVVSPAGCRKGGASGSKPEAFILCFATPKPDEHSSPDLPPDFRSRITSRIRMPLSSAFVMSYTVSAATDAATIASISTPVPATWSPLSPQSARHPQPPSPARRQSSAPADDTSGSASEVCFAAWIPGKARHLQRISLGIGSAARQARLPTVRQTQPAVASRRVSDLAETSTMWAWPVGVVVGEFFHAPQDLPEQDPNHIA